MKTLNKIEVNMEQLKESYKQKQEAYNNVGMMTGAEIDAKAHGTRGILDPGFTGSTSYSGNRQAIGGFFIPPPLIDSAVVAFNSRAARFWLA